MKLQNVFLNAYENRDLLGEVARSANPRVLLRLAPHAYHGYLQKRGKEGASCDFSAGGRVHFQWEYGRSVPELARLYETAKQSQWNASTDLDWSLDVDPQNPERALVDVGYLPLPSLPGFGALSEREKAIQVHHLAAWMLSQFLHGEQGALFAACQVTAAVEWMDAKLYGSTQVVDEGRHVEVFSRYLSEKLQKSYPINDNLFVILEALLQDSRWDVKFLGMQILIEGLALGAFGTLRSTTREPLLKNLLRYVITDEARHVHYGVTALRDFYGTLSETARREREDWAFEVARMLRNRFLAHEFYEEHYAHRLTRREWNRLVLESPYMDLFRKTMFKRLIPNLKRIHLLSDRVRPRYQELGLLQWENEKAAPELTAQDLLQES
jgi:hypothetical protein